MDSRLKLSHNLTMGDESGDDFSSEEGGAGGTQTVLQPRARTKTPSMYRVLLLNDDYTPMDFVIHVLQKFFQKQIEAATQIMMEVHTKGSGVAGTFTYEIAETKVFQVNQYARQSRYPLKCVMEKA